MYFYDKSRRKNRIVYFFNRSTVLPNIEEWIQIRSISLAAFDCMNKPKAALKGMGGKVLSVYDKADEILKLDKAEYITVRGYDKLSGCKAFISTFWVDLKYFTIELAVDRNSKYYISDDVDMFYGIDDAHTPPLYDTYAEDLYEMLMAETYKRIGYLSALKDVEKAIRDTDNKSGRVGMLEYSVNVKDLVNEMNRKQTANSD